MCGSLALGLPASSRLTLSILVSDDCRLEDICRKTTDGCSLLIVATAEEFFLLRKECSSTT
jgi:hypothetical protein